ncbi:Zn(2)-C6 fungal-type DNA-binding domain protein [Beauveria brongniartii RCEF 3172]|uniref:Zn(2)-C6 fungal-type DNA-binding domain protein n=1 Tax=Beauveria brongniartii RCEF 3172 TaxID=1081107 RepID=A0A162LSK2_9HYPO|nr:Zn(2)-C6 fungal-type DNA-binding domain protein [Beauveria brongniartii RCEF 3172]
MVNQRSKSGCWTCRLRRKKCSEDGMPCSNCKSRGVVCHGYGPRPAWKDRGQREQQEVERLQLRRRSQTRWHSQLSQQHSEQASEQPSSNVQENAASFCQSHALVFASPTDMTLQPSPPQSTEEQDGELYELASLDQQPSLPTPNTPFELSDFWVDGMEGLLSSTTPTLFEPAVTTLNGQVERSQRDGAGEKCTPAVMQTFGSASIHIHTLQEREIELMMQFLGQDFSRLHPCYQSSSITDRAWLMWLLQRSPTFFYAALSTSAYYKFLKTPPHHGKRTEHFREYDGLRNKAMELYCELLEVNGGRGGHQSLDWTAKETVICSVQLAMLESLSENFDGTIAYISSASDALAKLSEGRGYIVELSPIKSAGTPSVSGMERRAVDFFTCILIWVHILHCWSCQSLPTAASLYRRILSSTTLGETFLQVAGFDCWVLVLLMDAVEAAIWKGDQDAQNRLSVRELVMKTEAILSKIEHQMQ